MPSLLFCYFVPTMEKKGSHKRAKVAKRRDGFLKTWRSWLPCVKGWLVLAFPG
jgi:hypothetical protein